MTVRAEIASVPKDPDWWKNSRHGRTLVCSCSSVVVFVPVKDAICVRCRVRMEVRTANPFDVRRLAS